MNNTHNQSNHLTFSTSATLVRNFTYRRKMNFDMDRFPILVVSAVKIDETVSKSETTNRPKKIQILQKIKMGRVCTVCCTYKIIIFG